MIPSLPRPAWLRTATAVYLVAFMAFLFMPLIIVAVFSFNDAPYPAPPWRGFTLDWFLGNSAAGRTGLFADSELLGSIWTSCTVAIWVTLLSVLLGTANAFLIERGHFPGKQSLSVLMLAPLVIPGVILGISILAFASRIAGMGATGRCGTLASAVSRPAGSPLLVEYFEFAHPARRARRAAAQPIRSAHVPRAPTITARALPTG